MYVQFSASQAGQAPPNPQQPGRPRRVFLFFEVLKELFLGDTYTWLAIVGLRHAANPLWWIDGKWQGVAAFCCFLWTIVCLGISGLGFASALMPVNQGPLSILARILIGCHNFTPLFVYGCLICIFRNPSDPPIFEEDVCDGGNPLQPPIDDTDFGPNAPPNSTHWTKVTDFLKKFSFILLCWLLFLASWAYFFYWQIAKEARSATPIDPYVIVYWVIVGTYPFRVWPVILVTRLIVINFEKFEEVAKKLYLYHRQKPPVHVVVGVVPTHYLKDVSNSPLTTHDLFFMENLHECRSVKYEMSECDCVLDLKVTLAENENQQAFSPALDKRLCLKVEDQQTNIPLRVKEKILPLCDSWSPFIGVRVPGTTLLISEPHTRMQNNPNQVVDITQTTLLRSAYEVAGFKKQDQGSCFHYHSKTRILQKGSADFHETAIILQSPDQFWAWTPANDLSKRELFQEKHFRIEIKTPPTFSYRIPDPEQESQFPDQPPNRVRNDYQPSAELMAQLIRNARLRMNAFLEKYGWMFWFVVVVPLVNTMVFDIDILLPGNDVYNLSLYPGDALQNTIFLLCSIHILLQAAKLTEIFETLHHNVSTDISSGMIRFKNQNGANQLDAALFLEDLNQLKESVVIIVPISKELLSKVFVFLLTTVGPFLLNEARQRFPILQNEPDL